MKNATNVAQAKYTDKQPFDGKKGPAGTAQHEHQVRPWELTFPLWHSMGRLCALSGLSLRCNSYQRQPWEILYQVWSLHGNTFSGDW